MGVSALFLSTGLVAFLIAGYRGVLRAVDSANSPNSPS